MIDLTKLLIQLLLSYEKNVLNYKLFFILVFLSFWELFTFLILLFSSIMPYSLLLIFKYYP